MDVLGFAVTKVRAEGPLIDGNANRAERGVRDAVPARSRKLSLLVDADLNVYVGAGWEATGRELGLDDVAGQRADLAVGELRKGIANYSFECEAESTVDLNRISLFVADGLEMPVADLVTSRVF